MTRARRKPLDPDLYAAVVEEAKARFAVWPSAYASGWVVKTYKGRGGRYAGQGRKESTGLTKWFGEEWVDLSRPTADGGYEPCGRKKSNEPFDAAHYPKCRPLKEALRMTPDQVADAVRRKRRAEASAPGRGSRARAPKRVATYRENPGNAREKFLDAKTPEEQVEALASWCASDLEDVARNHPTPSFVRRSFTPEFFSVWLREIHAGDAEAIEAIVGLHAKVSQRLRPSEEAKARKRAEKRAEQKAARYERQGVEIDEGARNPLAKVRGKRVWLYHGTSSTLLDEILRNGLRPSMEHGQTSNIGTSAFTKASPEHVFLTSRVRGPASAEFYARNAARAHGGEPVVLRVLVDGDDLAYDPDDADIQSGRTQFVVPYVALEQVKEVDGEVLHRANPEGIDGDALAAWCASDESYAVLDETASAGSSWMAGACVLLAKALVATHPEAQLVGLEVDGDVQHVGALVGDVVYDALGAHRERAWARDWLAYEQLDPRTPARLVSLPPGVPASALPDVEAPATARDVRLVARALPA